MRNAIGRMLAAPAVLVLLNCSPSVPVGVWAYEDERSYLGISLEGDGRCTIVEAAKGGPGIGSICRYEVDGRTVVVFPHQPGATEPVDDTVTVMLTYRDADDTMVPTGEPRIVLTRTAELVAR